MPFVERTFESLAAAAAEAASQAQPAVEALLVVPWVVLNELDVIKDSKRKQAAAPAARRALHRLRALTTQRDSYVRGQSAAEHHKVGGGVVAFNDSGSCAGARSAAAHHKVGGATWPPAIIRCAALCACVLFPDVLSSQEQLELQGAKMQPIFQAPAGALRPPWHKSPPLPFPIHCPAPHTVLAGAGGGGAAGQPPRAAQR